MHRSLRVLLCLGMGVLWLAASAAPAAAAAMDAAVDASVQGCLRCHGMATLAERDPETGRLNTLHVDLTAFRASNHGQLRCLDCHKEDGFSAYPHSAKARAQTLACVDCHDDPGNPKFAAYRFKDTAAEFGRSVHARKLGERMTCFSCHDPHAFEVARKQDSVAAVIAQDNGMCRNCHESPLTFAGLTTRAIPDLDAAHDWLPATRLHWSKVRCVECHTPHGDRLSHEILGADRAERDCAVCHSRDSILMTQLYKFQAAEAREKLGFVNAALLNDAYIIGATRNAVLDWLSFGLVGLTLAGVGAHGLGRYLAARKRRNREG